MTEHEPEPFRAVFDLALDRLILTLREAQVYLGGGDGPRAIAARATYTKMRRRRYSAKGPRAPK